MMKKILFIHGYGALAESSGEGKRFRQVFGDQYEIHGVDYSQEEPEKGVEELLRFKNEWKPDAIVGCSLGAFFAMLVGGKTQTVVVNPCLCPSKELAILSKKNYDQYKPLEEKFNAQKQHPELAENVIGFFGTHDELICYKSLFAQLMGNDATRDFDCGHHVSIEGWQEMKPEIENVIDK